MAQVIVLQKFPQNKDKTFLSEADKRYIQDNYQYLTIGHISTNINTTYNVVKNYLDSIGLKATDVRKPIPKQKNKLLFNWDEYDNKAII